MSAKLYTRCTNCTTEFWDPYVSCEACNPPSPRSRLEERILPAQIGEIFTPGYTSASPALQLLLALAEEEKTSQATRAAKPRSKVTQDVLLLHRTAWRQAQLDKAQVTARRFHEPAPDTLPGGDRGWVKVACIDLKIDPKTLQKLMKEMNDV